MLGLSDFWSIYTRNAAGVLSAFPEFEQDDYSYPLKIAPLLLLLPFTISIGALAKSVFDFFTRSEPVKKGHDNTQEKITGLDDAQFDNLLKKIYGYHNGAQSSSSKALIETLQKTPQNIKAKAEVAIQAKNQCLKGSQLKEKLHKTGLDALGNDLKPKTIQQEVLEGEYLNEFLNYQQSLTANAHENTTKEQRALIIDYYTSSHNRGKRLKNMIYSFFNPIVEADLSTAIMDIKANNAC